MTKRLFDIIVSAFALTILSPFFIAIAVCIRQDSPGGIFFRQERIGRFERPFSIFKFRTMVMGAEAKGTLTIGKDSRVTTIGQWLRKTKLDELPQLINVLQGTMSLVGPRPELLCYVTHYPSDARQKIFALRPGMTDWVSIDLINENDILARTKDPEKYYIDQLLPLKIARYLHYAQHHSLFEDMRILLATGYHIIQSYRASQ